MSEETAQNTAQKVLTPKELQEKRDQITENFKNQIPLLTAQLEYENLLANIEQARAKRMEMIIRQAQMQAGPEPEKEEAGEPVVSQEKAPEAKTERSLKK
jgi:5-methylthioribose kinase